MVKERAMYSFMATDESLALVRKIVDRLRDARRVQGLTLRELSSMSGIDAGMISRAERGERWPSLAALLDLSKALNVKVSEILAAEKR